MAGDDPDPRVIALAREVERATRRVGTVEILVRQLAADVTGLARVVEEPPADDEGAEVGRVRAWLLAEDAGQARADLTDLVEWLARVYLRYPGAVLPSCWGFHPAVVEELWWLRQAHHDAYGGPDASWKLAGDWHDRQRPGVARRIRESIGGCELALHAEGGEQARPAPAVPLAAHADQLADTWTAHRTTPVPTPDQLTEADQHDRDQHRTNR